MTIKRFFNNNANQKYQIYVIDLKNNVMRNVRREQFRLIKKDVLNIFDSVVIEKIINLIKNQIFVIKIDVKMIFLIEDFEQSIFLRDSIRQTIKSKNIEMMQSFNDWIAMFREVLIKNFAFTNKFFSRVNVNNRCASKHYEIRNDKKFDVIAHAHVCHTYELLFVIRERNAFSNDELIHLEKCNRQEKYICSFLLL